MSTRLQNLSDRDFNLSRSCKVECDVVGLPVYGSAFKFTSNIWPKSPPLRDIRISNLSDLYLSDLEFDLSRSLNVKCDGAITPPPYFPYIVSYKSLIVTHDLTHLLYEI